MTEESTNVKEEETRNSSLLLKRKKSTMLLKEERSIDLNRNTSKRTLGSNKYKYLENSLSTLNN